MITVIYHAHGHEGDTVIGVDSVPFKLGTKGKTIRGVGKAMRGYGKAMTGRKK